VLCWRRDGAANAFVVTLGYVEPTSRRRGVFRELHSELRKRADAEGVGRIMFQVHPANVDAVEVARKLGAGLASLSFETILKA
jgi:L-amino acid N-acyltransferase YncA